MNRLLSILVTLFILFLVYLWINHLMGPSRSDKGKDTIIETQPVQTIETPEEYSLPDDDTPEEGTSETQEETPQEEAKPDPEPVKKETPEVKSEEPKREPVTPPATTPVKKTTPPPAPPAPESKPTKTDAGAHLVIAGNFLERANAEERVRELKKLGYTNAEVVNFELSEYHTACAGRYTNLDEARRVAKKIKDLNGIDTYVRHGN